MKKFMGKTVFVWMIIGLSQFLFVGCEKDKAATVVKSVKFKTGQNQCLLSGEESKEIRVFFESPKLAAFLGGKGKEAPVPGVKVTYKVDEKSDLEIIPIGESVSDEGGMIRFKVKTGTVLGDNYVKVIPVGFEKAAKTLRIINGIKISGNKQEAYVGTNIEEPITIELKDADNKPIVGAKVYFTITSPLPAKKVKAEIKPMVKTNSEGIAETTFKIGKKTSEYKINAEIVHEKINTRGIQITQMGIDMTSKTGLIVTVLGGLAIFIFGMKLMGEGLQLVAGEKMKNILQFFAKNRFVAVLAGTLVTGVIQSSSTCTVMVVGFINAGLLQLEQSIGIIFGANIGTTVTAQIIAFKIKDYALPAIIIGLVMIIIMKRQAWKSWGQTVLGFGMLFLGMGIMSSSLKSVATYPTFINFFKMFDCTPINGSMPIGAVLGAIAIGTVMTVVIQSSSATIGIALTLAATGLINFYTAVPLILGDNIGTTITAALASLGANRRAKQAACAHFMFNILGTTYMFLLFFVNIHGKPAFLWFINEYAASGNVFAEVPENITRHIAMAHTFFNVFNVLIFLPFIPLIAKICEFVIPIHDKEDIALQYLEPHLLNTPSIALDQSIKSIRYMVKESWLMVTSAVKDNFIPCKLDDKLQEDLVKREEKIDELQEDISNYLVQLTQRELTENQSELIPMLMHCNNDAEKIADHTNNILSLTKRLEKAKAKLSDRAKGELQELWDLLTAQAEHVISCLNSTDKSDIKFALKNEKKINELAKKLEKNHIKRASEGKCDMIVGIIFIEIVSELEAVGDGFANIAERAEDIQKHHVNLA